MSKRLQAHSNTRSKKIAKMYGNTNAVRLTPEYEALRLENRQQKAILAEQRVGINALRYMVDVWMSVANTARGC